ncbi:MAG TPA: tRNA (cytidine(34)-2'-O)-methyltransferase [Burkholderiales bacterium]|nr:tRNA (cytidine(34)-2'-O)-methyltransferase [Burkholderiales bacterium]
MFEIVLVHPEIPPNTGNVIRLAANAGCRLHLVEPLGYTLEDKQLRRAGLDYHDLAQVRVHPDWAQCLAALGDRRLLALTTRAARSAFEVRFQAGDALVFGAETTGLPAEILDSVPDAQRLRLPLRPGNRSLNLSNAVAVTVYEAWRQLGFAGSS